MEAPAGAADDALLTEDDALDRHPALLPAVQLVERAAALWEAGGGQGIATLTVRSYLWPLRYCRRCSFAAGGRTGRRAGGKVSEVSAEDIVTSLCRDFVEPL